MPLHAPVHVLDDYYLAITLLVTVGYQLVGFSIAFAFRFDTLTDWMGGSNFVGLSVLTLALSGTADARHVVASGMMMLWGARLAGFLLFRILKTGRDSRFDDKRDKFVPLLGFWLFQMLWVWTVSLPVTILNSPRVLRYRPPSFGQATDIVAIVLFVVGFAIEAVADVQKYRFRQGAGKQPGAVCDVALFRWSRHPNYFGEIMVQLSIYVMAVTPASSGAVPRGTGARAALYASSVGFVFLTALLMFVSGLTLQERPGAKKRYEQGGRVWRAYETYLRETSILIPMPPALWKRLPTVVKRTVGLEFPIYVFDPAQHADPDAVRQHQAEQGRSESGANGHRQSTEPLRS